MQTPHRSFSCVSTPENLNLGCPAFSHSRLGLRLRGWTAIHKAAFPSLHGPFCGNNAYTAGLECSPAIHRLRLWGLALGSASPCADCHGAGILGFTVSKVFTLICAYSFRHPHFVPLHPWFPPRLRCSTNALLPRSRKTAGQASAGRLIPTILGAFPLDE